MAQRLEVGEIERLRAEFRDVDGALDDPTTVTLTVTAPDATETIVVSPDAELLNPSVGVWEYDLTVTAAGVWTYRFAGTGDVTAGETAQLTVYEVGIPGVLDAGVEAAIRVYVGTSHAAADLFARYERLGSANAVSLEVLRSRRSELLTSALSYSVHGDYSESGGVDRVKALDAAIAELVAKGADPDGGVPMMRRLTRPGFSRSPYAALADRGLDAES